MTNSAQSDTLFKIYQAVVHLQGDERERELDRFCGTDQTLREQVVACLAMADTSEHDLTRDMLGSLLTTKITPPNESVPEQIGPYRVLRLLGEGGMGRVYLAEQEEPRRQVALKLMKPGLDGEGVIKRFHTEREVLSRLNHDHVAQIFEGGTDEQGRPFYTMAFVDGCPITAYCRRERLSLEQRLALFSKVCQGVHHAHLRGVIHRDLKPSNILVEERDGEAVPKVIDFGIAKVLQGEGPYQPSATLAQFAMDQTAHGDLLGSLGYLSPEQTTLSQDDVDFRSDIFALGIVLYECLTGCYPYPRFESGELSWHEMLEVIRHHVPVLPSKRLNKEKSGFDKALPESWQIWHRRLRGDLNWVVMKALAKEKQRRYASAQDLHDDLQRFLNHQPVLAGPSSPAYRFRRWARRNKGAVIAASLVLASLIVGLVGTSVGMMRAKAAAQRAETTLDFLKGIFQSPNPNVQGADIKVRDLLLSFSEKLANDFDGRPEIRTDLQRTLASNYLDLGLADEAITEAERALSNLKLDDDGDAKNTVRMHFIIGQALTAKGAYTGSEAKLREALQLAKNHLGDDHVLTYSIREKRAFALNMQGNLDDALSEVETLVEDTRETLGIDHSNYLSSRFQQAEILIAMGNNQPAERILRGLLAKAPQTTNEDRVTANVWRYNLVKVLVKQEKLQEAESLSRQTLAESKLLMGDDHSNTLGCENQLVIILEQTGNVADAEPVWQRILEKLIELEGADHPNSIVVRNNLAMNQKQLEKFDQATTHYELALASASRSLPRGNPISLMVKGNLANLLGEQGQHKRARRLLKEVLADTQSTLGDGHPRTCIAANNLAAYLLENGQMDEAKRLTVTYLPKALEVSGPESKISRALQARLQKIETLEQNRLMAQSSAK